ncbi:3'-5' exoribonuclease YhaM [Salsuginibacillus kocurii]|uniref:3'-5' exoribonuclease YhaM n=1 Tax=Salsuginibacillus kocurii TaxID=427078 RepID=UPI000380947E|nr:3'-5' exoribonuclease YhaM [Salsuginibacillus kocurii]
MAEGIRLKKVGEKVDQYALIRASTRGIASNQKPFLTLMLSDKSGDIEAKLWGVTPEDEGIFQARTIVHIAGEVIDFKGRMQLKIAKIRPVNNLDQVNITDFVKAAPLDAEAMFETVQEYIFDMKNPNLQRLTRHILKKYQEAFKTSPAATKNHHEFMSGLAYHVISMLHLSKALVQLYPTLDADLLYSGVILHDLGKTRELTGPIDTAYTLEGNLIGHISIMSAEIEKAATELNIQGEEPLMLQHMILSHHGKGEWGSPKVPLIKEAEMLHYIDNIDARMNMLEQALETVDPGSFSERIFAMENRQFYKPSFSSSTSQE